jgi:hypothetical protein
MGKSIMVILIFIFYPEKLFCQTFIKTSSMLLIELLVEQKKKKVVSLVKLSSE